MTADRWWVRWGARWLARAHAVSPLVRMGMLVMTGLSTGLITLQQYGHGSFAWPLIGLVIGGTIVFTWLYTEGGVYNQQQRDHADFGTNFAGPTMRIDDELIGAAVFAAVHERPPTEEEQQAIAEAVDRPWKQYRNGISLNGHGADRSQEEVDA